MKLKVKDISKFTNFKYPAYMNHGVEIEKPQGATYEVGDVIRVKKVGERPEVAVVLGCIGNGEVRTELDGMVSEENIRPATIQDFDLFSPHFSQMLLEECMGKDEKMNYKTGKVVKK